MQLYAFDKNNAFTNVINAERGKNYYCIECGEPVRVRGGTRMRQHFYHFHPSSFCRQEGKGLEHLQVQEYLLKILPFGEATMEKRFLAIHRVADVAWENKKIVFEVQCAHLSPEEALGRTADYTALGWQVIWILHDSRYNANTLSPLEEALLTVPHYYTNINATGEGVIYDQLTYWKDRRRYVSTAICPIEICPQPISSSTQAPALLQSRMNTWPLHLAQDYLSLWLLEPAHPLWQELARYIERPSLSVPFQQIKNLIHRLFIKPYFLLVKSLLESCCKKY